MAGERLVRMMRELGQTPENQVAAILTGTVTSINPLKIKIDDLELTETFLVVSTFCREMKFTEQSMEGTTHHHSGVHGVTEDAQIGSFTFTMWEGLAVGDDVIIMKMNRGQKYYVVEPLGGAKTK